MINANLKEPVFVNTHALPWIESPLPGVQRRMLERDGDEVARATSIVRYAPGSDFSPHTHGGGEEFLVLDGIFSDEHGDYPAGTYVRNPTGSSHRPSSKDGCTIFVKLRQMDPDDQQQVRIDTGTTAWSPGRVPGAEKLHLYTRGTEEVALVRLEPISVRSEPRKNSHRRPPASSRNNPVCTEGEASLDRIVTLNMRGCSWIGGPLRTSRFTRIGPESQISRTLRGISAMKVGRDSPNRKCLEHSRVKVRFGI